MRALTYFIAVTQDGYIAGPDGQTDRFEQGPELIDYLAEHYPETLPTPARAHFGIDAAPQHFDAVVMGRATYDVGAQQGLLSPYAHLDRQVVVTGQGCESVDPSVDDLPVEFVSDPLAAVREMKSDDGLGIWLCGGGVVAGHLIDEIDELIVKRQPMVLGGGRPMFAGGYQPTGFDLVARHIVGAVVVERLVRRA